MNELEWTTSTDLHRLLRFASGTLRMDRELRLFSIACIDRIPYVYNLEVATLLEFAKQHFDEGRWCLGDLQRAAEHGEISRFDAPFHLAWSDPLQAALRVVNGILIDTDWADHGCLPVFREIFGNPFRPVSVQVTESIQVLAERAYRTGTGSDKLGEALSALPELADHFTQSAWHPRGCWVLDTILKRRRDAGAL